MLPESELRSHSVTSQQSNTQKYLQLCSSRLLIKWQMHSVGTVTQRTKVMWLAGKFRYHTKQKIPTIHWIHYNQEHHKTLSPHPDLRSQAVRICISFTRCTCTSYSQIDTQEFSADTVGTFPLYYSQIYLCQQFQLWVHTLSSRSIIFVSWNQIKITSIYTYQDV